ncbi:hypothetical protein BDV19DRAFT_392366 [Aspergillus venezuelensis]
MASATSWAPLNLHLDTGKNYSRNGYGDYSTVKAFEILKEYLESNGSKHRAYSQLSSMFPKDRPTNLAARIEVDDAQEMLGCLILEVAEQIPFSHPAQMALAKLFALLRDSPRFRMLIDGYQFHQYCALKCTYMKLRRPDSALNAVAFQARLTALGAVDNRSYMIFSIAQTLEQDQPNRPDSVLGVELARCAVWILCSGLQAYHTVVLYPPDLTPRLERVWGCGAMYNGPIFGLDRWSFWRSRLLAYVDDLRISQEHREMCLDAALMMDAFKRSVKW